jgi:hypothetical protein
LRGRSAQPDDPAVGAALHRAGIDYAVCPHSSPAADDRSLPASAAGRLDAAECGALNPWFQPVAKTPDAVIYRSALRRPRAAAPLFDPVAASARASRRRLDRALAARAVGELTLFMTGPRRRVGLVLTLSSFAQRGGSR